MGGEGGNSGLHHNTQQKTQGKCSITENFNIVSFNVRGLNSPYKQSKILDFSRREKTDIALLQETHLKPSDISRVQNRFYKPIVASADGTCTKGAMILMRCSVNVAIERIGSDNKGLLAFCCASIQGEKIAFVSIYAPAVFEADFFPTVSSHLLKLSDYQLYVGSDMNATRNNNLDKSYSTVLTAQDSASKALNLFLKDLNLADVWRVYNPTIRDYTFFSSRHKTFS